MCVALPGTVLEVQDRKNCLVDFSGNQVMTDCRFVPVTVGDKVLVHAGCVLQKIDEEEFRDMEELFAALEEFGTKGEEGDCGD